MSCSSLILHSNFTTKMKKIVIAVAALMAIGTASFAQDAKKAEPAKTEKKETKKAEAKKPAAKKDAKTTEAAKATK